MKIAILVGTRPEIIKMSPVIRACDTFNVPHILIDTKQHYSDNMSDIFYKDLGLRKPDHTLETDAGSHAIQISSMLIQLEQLLEQTSFDVLLVQGDTNSVLAGALSASRKGIKIGHVEAGLRSRDRSMTEEINRIMTDHISDYLFATSNQTVENLQNEGIADESIWNVGNTVVDATLQTVNLARRRAFRKKLRIKKDYLVVTLHRPANVDNLETLDEILSGIEMVMKEYGLEAAFSVHPRTKKQLANLHRQIPEDMHLIDPPGYLDFISLQSDARLVMTDSGGIQEEACIMQVPCVTLRTNTERPETVTVGANILGGVRRQGIVFAARQMMNRIRGWSNPYGNGTSGEQIIQALNQAFAPRYNKVAPATNVIEGGGIQTL